MKSKEDVKALFDATAYDSEGERLGSVKEVYVHDATLRPIFAEVGHGLFGLSSSVVPLRGARLEGDRLTLGFTRESIKGAPDPDTGQQLTKTQQRELLSYFGVDDAPEITGLQGSYDDERAS
ncbi:PRC-barrel domain-containing protein [Corynebacterium otitidis]|uniref:PRC-barrel domain-containing protein n=1 Tax=Corynebacterium otitidis ATCC 51513 TaxID=883169 RepID=I7LCR1_9CORY|nr:PRC-barrel domain-containing protein [Corynebacterium otitidis]EJZ81482.1 hypothetical protein HMPREF9719_01525 [Corynebacterium otitidis ATCC 51513]KKO83837.1 hypothetical protein AAV33_04175 [Corynebacterium otitidis]CCI84174.1 hypothetical protein BN46_1462 [Corynebacterium otitidis ATCC 51513]